MTPYPVVEHRTLGHAPRGFLRQRRELTELPQRRPDTELVAKIDGHYQRLPGHLRGTEQPLIDASSVLVIDVSPRHPVEVRVEVASKTPGEPFTVCVTFSCTVTDTLEIARQAVRDIAPELQSYIMSDPQLMAAGRGLDMTDIEKFRERVTARITASWSARRPSSPGLSIELSSIEPYLPEHLREHATDTRAEIHRQALEALKDQFTFTQARLIEEVLLRGPEAAQALALRLNDARFMGAANRAFAERGRRLDHLLAVTRMFSDGGHLDTVPFDTTRLIDELVNSIIGPPAGDSSKRSDESSVIGLDSSDGGTQPSALSSPADDDVEDRPTELPDDGDTGD